MELPQKARRTRTRAAPPLPTAPQTGYMIGPFSTPWFSRPVAATCVEINQCVGCGRPGYVERWGTGIATPSSRCRIDGVEVDAMIQQNAP